MKKLSSVLSVLALLGLLAIATVAFAANTAASAPVVDPHKSLVVSRGAAEASLRKTLDSYSGPIKYLGTKDRPGVRTYEFSGSTFHALVDVSDGHVALLTMAIDVANAPLRLTSDQAKAAALKFLGKIGSPTAGMDVAVYPVTGGGFPGYTVQFQRSSDGAALPDYRTVEIDGIDGRVVSMVDVRRPTKPTHVSKLTKDAAVRQAKAGNAGARSADARLVVTFDKAGAQKQVWEVQLAPTGQDIAGKIVYVDADTGALVDPSK
jgi:hypothetical protein